MKTFIAQTADQWRKWLDKHHDSAAEVWLVFHKVHTGVASIAYLDALDEALCFGWVDSLVKRLAPSHQRRYVGWIESAKREETKAKRLREAIRLLTAGTPLGLK